MAIDSRKHCIQRKQRWLLTAPAIKLQSNQVQGKQVRLYFPIPLKAKMSFVTTFLSENEFCHDFFWLKQLM